MQRFVQQQYILNIQSNISVNVLYGFSFESYAVDVLPIIQYAFRFVVMLKLSVFLENCLLSC